MDVVLWVLLFLQQNMTVEPLLFSLAQAGPTGAGRCSHQMRDHSLRLRKALGREGSHAVLSSQRLCIGADSYPQALRYGGEGGTTKKGLHVC